MSTIHGGMVRVVCGLAHCFQDLSNFCSSFIRFVVYIIIIFSLLQHVHYRFSELCKSVYFVLYPEMYSCPEQENIFQGYLVKRLQSRDDISVIFNSTQHQSFVT